MKTNYLKSIGNSLKSLLGDNTKVDLEGIETDAELDQKLQEAVEAAKPKDPAPAEKETGNEGMEKLMAGLTSLIEGQKTQIESLAAQITTMKEGLEGKVTEVSKSMTETNKRVDAVAGKILKDASAMDKNKGDGGEDQLVTALKAGDVVEVEVKTLLEKSKQPKYTLLN